MGHQRLGNIPKSQRWDAVVASVASGSGGFGGGGLSSGYVANVADRTLDAAAAGLERAIGDPGLSFTFFLLTQIALAAREDDWRPRLRRLGIRLSENDSLFALTSQLQRVVDDHLESHGPPTDVSEMAQQAAGEAIAVLAGPNARSLFGSGSNELQDAVRQLSTSAGFSRLGQRFFGAFITRFLNFYLSRTTAGRLRGANELSRFNHALATHCEQSARIVHDFCGEWYSKTEWERGIDQQNSNGCVAVALRKLRDELHKQREGQ
jgi:hypothetical protein